MKKFYPIILLCFFVLLTSSNLVPSNSIGQITDESKDGYYLQIVNENKRYLMKDDKLVRTYVTEEVEKTKVVTETESDGKSKVTVYDNRGNMIRTSEDGITKHLTYDDNSHLVSSYTTDSEGKEISRRVYYRDPNTGALLGIKDNDKYSFYTDDGKSSIFLQGQDDKFESYETFFGSVTFVTTAEGEKKNYKTIEGEDGSLTFEFTDNKMVYSKDGLLIEDGGKKYFYTDNKILDYTEIEKDGVLVKDYYQDGAVIKSEEFENNRILKRTTTKPDSVVEELFEGGKLYAIITYSRDGKTVKNLEYV